MIFYRYRSTPTTLTLTTMPEHDWHGAVVESEGTNGDRGLPVDTEDVDMTVNVDADRKDVDIADIGQRMWLRQTERIGILVERGKDDEDADGIDVADEDEDDIQNQAKTRSKPNQNASLIRCVNLRNSPVNPALDDAVL